MATLEQELAGVLDNMGNWSLVPEAHHVQSYAPAVMAKIRYMIEHGIHQRHGAHLGHMLHAWYNLLERHTDLARQARIWNEESNIIVSTPWDNLAANTSSSTCTLGAPWSGIPFMLLDILVPAELTPRGRLVQFNFAGINFASPSTQTDVVQYSTGGGSLGTPGTTGMDLTVFYSNKTAPHGRRGFRAWTGWIFDPSAKILIQVFNPDLSFARSYDFAWLMRSSPCQNVQFERDMAIHSRHDPHGQYHQIANMIHGAVLGLSGMGGPAMGIGPMHGMGHHPGAMPHLA